MNETNILRAIVFLTAAFYAFYSLRSRKLIQDEREKQIHYRTLELVQTVSSAILILFVAVYVIFPKIDAIYLVVGISVSWFLSYPIGNRIIRSRM